MSEDTTSEYQENTPEETGESTPEGTSAPSEPVRETDDGAPDLETDEAAALKKEEENPGTAVPAGESGAITAEEAGTSVSEEAIAAVAAGASGSGVRGVLQRLSSLPGKAVRGFLGWKRWQQALAVLLVVVLALAGIAYGYFHSKYILMDINDGDFSSTEISADDEEQDELENEELKSRQESGELDDMEAIESTAEIMEDDDVFNILLIGTDDRTVEFSENARGDTCILVSVNRSSGEVNLVSFERAIGVKIPSGEYEGQWDWLTHTFWYGGPSMMMRVIRENFKVDVTRYVRVNIRTFMKLVDAVGGVDIEMTEAEVNNINHPEGTYTADHIKSLGVADEVQQDLEVGVNHLNGATAMLYARLRSIDDDWHRVVRQRNVILASVESMKDMSLTELDAMLNSVLPMVQTNLTEADIASLLTDLPTLLNMDFGSITFPLQNTYGLMDGMSGRRVLALDFETNAAELQSLLYGETTAEELEEKYENMEDELEDYSYKDSESWQENYEDAESIAARSYSYVSSDDAADGEETGEELSDEELLGAETSDGTDASVSTADLSDAASLGEVESVTTDPDTGVVTAIYYNADTGVRTAVAVNPATGDTAVAQSAEGDETADTGEDAQESAVSDDILQSSEAGTADGTLSADTTQETATESSDVSAGAATETETFSGADEALAAALAEAKAAAQETADTQSALQEETQD